METFQHYSVKCILDKSSVHFQLSQSVFDSTECCDLELTYQYILCESSKDCVCIIIVNIFLQTPQGNFGLDRLFMVFDSFKLLITKSISTGIS